MSCAIAVREPSWSRQVASESAHRHGMLLGCLLRGRAPLRRRRHDGALRESATPRGSEELVSTFLGDPVGAGVGLVLVRRQPATTALGDHIDLRVVPPRGWPVVPQARLRDVRRPWRVRLPEHQREPFEPRRPARRRRRAVEYLIQQLHRGAGGRRTSRYRAQVQVQVANAGILQRRRSAMYTMYIPKGVVMSALHYDTVALARQNFKDLLDAAQAGIPSAVTRDRHQLAVVDGEQLREVLQRAQPSRAQASPEAEGWSITLPGLPIAADGDTFDDALADAVAALREYAEDWTDRLRIAPNHAGNWALVQLVTLSTDEQLQEWLRA